MSDIAQLFYLRNDLLKSKDPENVLIGRLLNTIIIARDKKELPELSEVLYKWIKSRT